MIGKKIILAGICSAMLLLGGCGKTDDKIEEYGGEQVETTAVTEGSSEAEGSDVTEEEISGTGNDEVNPLLGSEKIEWRDKFDAADGKIQADIYIDYVPVPASELPMYNYKNLKLGDVKEEEIVKNLFGETATQYTGTFEETGSMYNMLDAYMCFYCVAVSPMPDKMEFKAWVDEENYFIHTYEGTYRNMDCMLMVGYGYECNCSFLAMYPINAGDAINHPEYAVMGRLTPSSMSYYVNESAAGDVVSSENGTETDDKNVNKCTLDDDELLATCTDFLNEYLMIEACEDAFTTEDQSYYMVSVEDGEVQKGPRQDVVFYTGPEDMFTTEDPLTGELKDPDFQEKNGYYVALSNNIGGIFTYGASAASYRNYAYYDMANYNQGGFYVSDDGVMGFILLFDGWLTEKIAEDSSILSFEILKESFIKEVSENVDPSKLNTDKLYFKNMYLTYYGITNPDDETTGTLVPALWFTATEGTTTKMTVIINALDGSLIDISY